MKKKVRTYINEQGETEATVAFTEKPEDELCDFCSALKPPYKIYPCPDFPHPMSPLHWSRGDWNACVPCAELIDADDREGLAQRCMLMHTMEYDEVSETMMRAFHNAFFANRKDK
jgi:hypothetical protein